MINVAVIGCGYWGPNLIRNFSENQRCSLRWCCDLNPARLKLLKGRYPAVKFTTELADILKDKKIDAVAVATPLKTHYTIARRALLAGKHVLIEKPFTHSAKKAEELIRLAEKKKLSLMVGYTYIYSPPVLKIKDIISSNEIGHIHYIHSIRVHFWHLKPEESVIWDLASHDLSIIFYWLKPSEYSVFCYGSDCLKRGYIDTAHLTVNFKRGPIVYIFTSWLAPIKMRNMILTGSKKMVFYNDIRNMEKIKIYNHGPFIKEPKSYGEYQLTYRAGNVYSPNIDTYEPLGREIENFLHSIQSSGTDKRKDNLLFYLQIVKTLEAADKSLKSNKEIVLKP